MYDMNVCIYNIYMWGWRVLGKFVTRNVTDYEKYDVIKTFSYSKMP